MAGETSSCYLSNKASLDAESPLRYNSVGIYSPWDQPQGLSRGYFLSVGREERGRTHAC
jgi:hypothetical protein